MGKCPFCNRKAKRSCLLPNVTAVCSACCGEVRKEVTCSQCSYYQPPRRNYRKIPAYTPKEMNASSTLQDISEIIESAICAYDCKSSWELKDPTAICLLELLLDRYHFQDVAPQEENEIVLNGFTQVIKAAKKKLHKIPNEEVSKVLGAIYFVAVRRSKGNREYLNIIRQYAGVDTAHGKIYLLS